MRARHPAIESINSMARDAGRPVATETPNGPAALDSAVVALLATMVDLLGLMVGHQMAGHLLTLSCAEQGEAERPLARGTDA